MSDKDRKKPRPSENEGGYGGGRNRAEETPEHGFGDRGLSSGRGSGEGRPEEHPTQQPEYPKGVEDVGPDDPDWQERFVRQNADKYGQAGGQPTKQRGPSQSDSDVDKDRTDIGSDTDLSPRGGVGIRETEKWPDESKGQKS